MYRRNSNKMNKQIDGSESISDSSDVGDACESMSSTTQTNNDITHSHHSEPSLARSETKAVKKSKLLVLICIAMAAAATGIATYFVTRNNEMSLFRAEFFEYAKEIALAAQDESSSSYASVKSLSTTVSAFAAVMNMTWPLVTVPFLEIQGINSKAVTKATQISLVPLVKKEERVRWEVYSVKHQQWIDEGLTVSQAFQFISNVSVQIMKSKNISETIWTQGAKGKVSKDSHGIEQGSKNYYGPVWQQAPAPHDPYIVNFDLFSHADFEPIFKTVWESQRPVLSKAIDLKFLYGGAISSNFIQADDDPHSFMLQPIFSTVEDPMPQQDKMVGFLVAALPWDIYFQNILRQGVKGITLILTTCDSSFTYQINGPIGVYVGPGDMHDARYSDFKYEEDFAPYIDHQISENGTQCKYILNIYPTTELEEKYTTNKPVLYSLIVVSIFIVTAIVFTLYDYLVQVRQDKVMATAKRTTAIVASLFPAHVRDQIMSDVAEQVQQDIMNKKKTIFGAVPKAQLRSFLHDNQTKDVQVFDSKPIAELFPEATIMFADIAGFTAWSSMREPTHVFMLLETIYASFDEAARQRRVFKVETVGDCYVAVCGVPDPRKDHAVVMARFARDCLRRMNDVTKKLEVSLGPDTGDLALRIGLHSGPVTAGVLRGDKSRFQLFGDTVNTTARIEASGARNRIHLSSETAQLLMNAGKSHWLSKRDSTVEAKGKGELQTYWMEFKLSSGSSIVSSSNEGTERQKDLAFESLARIKIDEGTQDDRMSYNDKAQRLVDWNTDTLARLLRQIIARRSANLESTISAAYHLPSAVTMHKAGQTVLDEVKEIVQLPEYEGNCVSKQENVEDIELMPLVYEQLCEYVSIVKSMYRNNPFHNFEHASHVTMSVVKLLSRIVAPDRIIEAGGSEDDMASTLHDHTYGITSDPLTQFACVFAAMIHDVDHSGVPNAQLVKEQVPIASVYKGKSVAEQNSVDVAWKLLMDSSFADLRQAIYSNEAEMLRFRQLVVNAVMATDIVDPELKALRNARWERAFKEDDGIVESARDKVNRKATIVIEHLIQASDVAHTMQHWHVYRKWNERFFQEMYQAYLDGRAEKDPSEFWYKGEIGFFDFYIIPLAKKLKQCGVFGVSSDEYLNYAEMNRAEWEHRGQEIVSEMVEKYKQSVAKEESGMIE